MHIFIYICRARIVLTILSSCKPCDVRLNPANVLMTFVDVWADLPVCAVGSVIQWMNYILSVLFHVCKLELQFDMNIYSTYNNYN